MTFPIGTRSARAEPEPVSGGPEARVSDPHNILGCMEGRFRTPLDVVFPWENAEFEGGLRRVKLSGIVLYQESIISGAARIRNGDATWRHDLDRIAIDRRFRGKRARNVFTQRNEPNREGAAYDARLKSNAMSCVLRVSSPGSGSLLLTGDIEREQEAALVVAGTPLRTDVLIVPHHGSKTSSSAAFLDAVRPRIAIFQAGYRNRFGHPAPPVLARYRERGIEIVASPSCGAWLWQGEREGQGVCQRDVARRYWHHAPQVVPP